MNITNVGKLFLLPFMLMVSACASTSNSELRSCEFIDDVKLNIEQRDGSDVSICGFLKYEFEDKNLYDSAKAAKEFSSKKCLSIGLHRGVDIDLAPLNNRRVLVRGVVTKEFCPEGTICVASCSAVGVFVRTVSALD
jgi:hypothetical protein